MAHDRQKAAPCIASCVDDRHTRLFLEVELPGVRKEDIRLTMHDDSLYLTAVRADGYVEYTTTYSPCCPVKANAAEARYENGLLKIEAPFTKVLEGAVNIDVK